MGGFGTVLGTDRMGREADEKGAGEADLRWSWEGPEEGAG